MFLEKLVEPHRVHPVVVHGVRFPFFVGQHQHRIHLSNFFGDSSCCLLSRGAARCGEWINPVVILPANLLNQLATYSISAVILPLTSFNVNVSTPASFTFLKVTESPSSSTRLKSQVPDFASLLKRTRIFFPAASTSPLRRRFASQSLLSAAVI